MPFEIAGIFERLAYFVSPADLLLEPPESYIILHELLVALYGTTQLVFLRHVLSVKLEAGQTVSPNSSNLAKMWVYELSVGVNIALLLCLVFSDQDGQVSAYQLWCSLHSMIGWIFARLESDTQVTAKSSFESWVLQFFSFVFGNGLFAWRYCNVAGNWASLNCTWAICAAILTFASYMASIRICVGSFYRSPVGSRSEHQMTLA